MAFSWYVSGITAEAFSSGTAKGEAVEAEAAYGPVLAMPEGSGEPLGSASAALHPDKIQQRANISKMSFFMPTSTNS